MIEKHYEGLQNRYSFEKKKRKREREKDSKGLLSPKGNTISNLQAFIMYFEFTEIEFIKAYEMFSWKIPYLTKIFIK